MRRFKAVVIERSGWVRPEGLCKDLPAKGMHLSGIFPKLPEDFQNSADMYYGSAEKGFSVEIR
jgi:hypothetical protein